MRTRAALAVTAAALLAGAFASGAQATRECDGLDVCISVPGPWVAVLPPAGNERARKVEYQLSCPRGSIVGGLDAILGDRSLDVVFLGTLGSPVNPGITTSESAVFVATYSGRAPTYFRPLLGCIPTSGGGRETTSVAAPAPRPPLVRRVRNFRVRAGAAQTFVHGCASGERLVGSSHAVAFRTRAAPSIRALRGVGIARREVGDNVEVRAKRSGSVPARARVDVQVHVLCVRDVP